MIRGCHACTILLLVGRKFFTHFLASRCLTRCQFKSLITFCFISFYCNKHDRNFFVTFVYFVFNFLIYIWFTCELCLYFLNWVFWLKVSLKLPMYAHKQKAAAVAASRWGNADCEKPTFKDFQCQVGERNVNDAEANRNKYCAIIPNP